MTLEDRVAKCIGYSRFLQAHGVVWYDKENGNQAVGLVQADWVINCLAGLYDELPDEPYIVEGCECVACESERSRVAMKETRH